MRLWQAGLRQDVCLVGCHRQCNRETLACCWSKLDSCWLPAAAAVQVEVEATVRAALKRRISNLAHAPAWGTISSATLQQGRDAGSVVGRAVLLLDAAGVPLIMPNAAHQPVLSSQEQAQLLVCLLRFVLAFNVSRVGWCICIHVGCCSTRHHSC